MESHRRCRKLTDMSVRLPADQTGETRDRLTRQYHHRTGFRIAGMVAAHALREARSALLHLALAGLVTKLRGSFFDIFRRSEERRTERWLIAHYRDNVFRLLEKLDSSNYTAVLETLALPEKIRG